MNRGDLIRRVRSYTRDLSASIFRTIDITDFIQEGIDRIKSRIPELTTIPDLVSDDQVPDPLPKQFHYMLAVFSASRCFGQDERHYQASTLMNEFETKLEELLTAINNGEITIVDGDGNPIENANNQIDYVVVKYFAKPYREDDLDTGVEGV